MWRVVLVAAVIFMGLFGPEPGAARDVIDSAGRCVMVPDRVERVFAAGPSAAVALAVLEPEKLLGWPTRLHPGAKPYLGPRRQQRPCARPCGNARG